MEKIEYNNSIKEFNNIKEIVYNSSKEHMNKLAFKIKIKSKEGNKITYKEITYKELLEDINAFGTALYNLGYKDKRIAVLGRNRYEWIVAHLANLLGAIVSVPLDKDLMFKELESSLIRAKVDALVFDKKYLDKVEEIQMANNTKIKDYICMEDISGYMSVDKLIEKGRILIKNGYDEYINCEIDNEKLAILLFTSGTTSQSKAVMLSNKNIASNVYAIQQVEDIRSTDVNIAFLPFHHIFGSTTLIMLIAYGALTVFPDGLRYIKQNLMEYKVSLFVGVPILIESIYKALMKGIEKQNKTRLVKMMMGVCNFCLKLGIDIRKKVFKKILDELGGNLRLIISGGAPADPKISKSLNSLGIEVIQGYGLSETAPVICAEDKNYIRYGSVGKPMCNDEIKIVNKDSDGIGEIIVKGPNIMLGYYEMEEKTKEVIKDGYFYTGDLGYFDKDGYLFITGRNKNMIVLKNGKKVFPEELETLVNRIDLISESMVYGMPSFEDKNDIKLSVKIVYDKIEVEEKYGGISKEELYNVLWNKIKELNKSFPRYKHIQSMIMTDKELIKTTTKKVKRNEEMKLILKEIN